MVIFIYHDIRWGERAQIGFNAGDGYTSFALSEALSSQTLSIDRRSNIGEPGVFAYRIDGMLIITDLKNNYGHPCNQSLNFSLLTYIRCLLLNQHMHVCIVRSNPV